VQEEEQRMELLDDIRILVLEERVVGFELK